MEIFRRIISAYKSLPEASSPASITFNAKKREENTLRQLQKEGYIVLMTKQSSPFGGPLTTRPVMAYALTPKGVGIAARLVREGRLAQIAK